MGVGVNCAARGIAAIHEFFNGTGYWPSADKVYHVEAYIMSASEGIADDAYGVVVAYEALIHCKLFDEATRYRKEQLTEYL